VVSIIKKGNANANREISIVTERISELKHNCEKCREEIRADVNKAFDVMREHEKGHK